jgi:hypothetical protein
MKRIVVVLGVAALMVAMVAAYAGVAMAQATNETINIRSPESFTIDNPCPGYEEPIQVDGIFHSVYRVTQVEGDLYRYVIHVNTSNVTGIGLVVAPQ